jgi:hypothetical protein
VGKCQTRGRSRPKKHNSSAARSQAKPNQKANHHPPSPRLPSVAPGRCRSSARPRSRRRRGTQNGGPCSRRSRRAPAAPCSGPRSSGCVFGLEREREGGRGIRGVGHMCLYRQQTKVHKQSNKNKLAALPNSKSATPTRSCRRKSGRCRPARPRPSRCPGRATGSQSRTTFVFEGGGG